ncbi:MAG: hypothetical protein ACLT98_13505 [Eggerthellaceae bacterium]
MKTYLLSLWAVARSARLSGAGRMRVLVVEKDRFGGKSPATPDGVNWRALLKQGPS